MPKSVMCVAAIAWSAHPRWRLVAIGNRDEFHARPTAALAKWDDGSGIIAGRDLRAGGTWLGVTAAGRFALVTNFRVPGYPKAGLASRGGLITSWLNDEPLGDTAAMNPFNLCMADADTAQVVTNHPDPERHTLGPGVHGLSNGAFARPWPKTRQLCAALDQWLAGAATDPAGLFAALRSDSPLAPKAADEEGPDAPYSPVFIHNAIYGTRCSTVIMIDHSGAGTISERSFDEDGRTTGRHTLAI
ncbi:MAG: NRDE family protein [Novosphingobium sp.]